jgi:hypothetical protein
MPRRGTLELSWSVRGGVFMVAGMAVPEESFVISFGDVLVSTHSISFSHTFSDGLTLLLGMRVVTLLASCNWDKDAAEKVRSACLRSEGSDKTKAKIYPQNVMKGPRGAQCKAGPLDPDCLSFACAWFDRSKSPTSAK